MCVHRNKENLKHKLMLWRL